MIVLHYLCASLRKRFLETCFLIFIDLKFINYLLNNLFKNGTKNK